MLGTQSNGAAGITGRLAFLVALSILAILALFATWPGSASAETGGSNAQSWTVAITEIDDLKAVFATVRSSDEVQARARISGTVTDLTIDEGSQVTPGQVIGRVTDPKLRLKLRALEARIKSFESQLANARTELARGETLRKRGIIPEARLDTLRTAYKVAEGALKSARADRAVVLKQMDEGAVLAPAEGRVLKVRVTKGSVVLAGESLATIAANRYILRLEIPERHARFLVKGAHIAVGARGLDADQSRVSEGTIVQVYPEIQHGRVIADAEVPGLGDYFVGERALVWVPAGKRKVAIVPRRFVYRRYGLDYVRLAGKGRDGGTAREGIEVVVQLGRPAKLNAAGDAVEVLAGLEPGDRLIAPPPAQAASAMRGAQ